MNNRYEELNKNSTYLGRISDYLLFALDKDLTKKEFSLTENQYRMLCEYAVGRKPYIKQAERDVRVSKNMTFERTEENKRRIIKQLGNLFLLDDNIKAYNDMMNEARALATKRMVNEAEALGADGIVNIRYASSAIMQGAAEVIVYGTAVKFV